MPSQTARRLAWNARPIRRTTTWLPARPGRQCICGSLAMASAFSSSASSLSQRPPFYERSFPALFVRGGTSNGLIINQEVLPAFGAGGDSARSATIQAKAKAWASVLAPAMGAPDPVHSRELDGMGGGISSTSKVCVLAPSARDDADVDFTFVQVGVKDGKLDLAGNCGNMVSAVGPIAYDWGWVAGGGVSGDSAGASAASDRKTASCRIYNTNTDKIIHSRFSVTGDPSRYTPDGDYAIDGVAGTHSQITLSFLRPAGAKTGAPDGLPTGHTVDQLEVPAPFDRLGTETGITSVPASLVDVSNPGVFVRGSWLGFGNDPKAAAAAIEADTNSLRTKVEQIRRAGTALMGLDPDTQSVPKIVFLFEPGESEPDMDIRCVALSMGQVHKAVPLTLALCLGAASRIPGTLAYQIVEEQRRKTGRQGGDMLIIGHPSGRVDVGTTLDEADGTIRSAELHRTARVLMEGKVFY